MKPLIPATIALIAISLSATLAFAGDGTNSGGGGNIEPSTKADLQELVDNMDRHIWEVSDRYLTGGPILLTKASLKPELATITEKMTNTKYFAISESLQLYIKGLTFEVVDRPCYDGSRETDASTSNAKNSPICLSAKRLSRFSKSVLRRVLIPMVMHEVAHQFGFDENSANAFQRLTSLHLEYRTTYLASIRAYAQCAFATSKAVPKADKQKIMALFKVKTWPTNFPKATVTTACAAQSMIAGNSLERSYNGNLRAELKNIGLTRTEELLLLKFDGYDGKKPFSFVTMTEALTESPIVPACDLRGECRVKEVDLAYIGMLGAKAALGFIDKEVGRLQNLINTN